MGTLRRLTAATWLVAWATMQLLSQPFLGAAASAPAIDPNGPVPCLNLPLSTAELNPTACWVTGATSLVIAGTSPQDSSLAVVTIVQGQERRRALLPGSGRLSIRSVKNGQACLRDSAGRESGVELQTGTVQVCGATGMQSRSSTAANELIAPRTAASTPPQPTTSYYVFGAYLRDCGAGSTTACPLYNDGANEANPGITVLDFGAPCFNPNTLAYGTQLFNARNCTADSDLVPLAQAWIRGYQSTHAATAPMIVALGTSNSLTGADPPSFALSPAQMSASGAAWYGGLIRPVMNWASGLGALTIWAANDIEQSSSGDWYDAGTTRAWFDAYQSATGLSGRQSCAAGTAALLANYGDYVPSAPSWTANDVYYVSWGAPVACALPEIYYSSNASEWSQLNQWANSHSLPPIQFTGVMSEDGSSAQGQPLSAADSWNALMSATGQSPPYLTVIANVAAPPTSLGAPTSVTAVPGGSSATVSWNAPAVDGGAHISGYTVTPYVGTVAQTPTTVTGWPAPVTAVISGLTNGTAYIFTVAASNANGMGPASAPSNPVTPSDAFPYTAVSNQQYRLSNSDGNHWTDIDPATLALTVTPAADVTAVLSANADLWTMNAGFNQDLGIDVNGTIIAWKESGGFGGTFSPNAAFVNASLPLQHGTSYAVKLRWKTNKPEGSATIVAGAGPAAPFSPTRLTIAMAPSTGVVPASSKLQYHLGSNDGIAWVPVDEQNLKRTVVAAAGQTAIIAGNADLWTTSRGYNQDLGISIDGAAPIAWKESGGFAGTFSPNAAFVLATATMTPGSHTVTLVWKANKPVPANTVVAGAGPFAPFSPTTLTIRWVPSATVVDRVSQAQYLLGSSDGIGWAPMDSQLLTASITPGSNCLALLDANVDLWTSVAGVNQDVAIQVTPVDAVTYPGQVLGWKESGGFAGTFSPNAANLETSFAMASGITYTAAVLWKTNIGSNTAARGGAGPKAPFSPTRLTIVLLCG